MLQFVQGVSRRFLMVFCTVSALSGCAMSGFDLEAAMPDKNSITGSVAKPQPVETLATNDSSNLSDQDMIRSVVARLDSAQGTKKPVAWQNPATGSQGTITTVAEKNTDAGLCREFETSREAFDGAALYRGQACMAQSGEWALTSFAPL